jgi:DNA-binding NtrC family response regulator
MKETWDVLVLDDEPVVCDAIRLVLGEEDLRVAVVHDLATALAHEALGSCRLVFCDLMLPGESGLDAVRAIRQRRPGLPIVMITGYATAENEAKALAAGAAAVLPKPFDDTELVTLTRHALAQTEAAGKERTP